MDAISFFLPGKENFYEQEAGYAYLKNLAEEFTGQEVYLNRIYRLIYRLEGQLVIAQVGELCPVYQTRISVIFETCCTFVVVSEDHFYNPLVVRKDAVTEVVNFREEEAYLIAS